MSTFAQIAPTTQPKRTLTPKQSAEATARIKVDKRASVKARRNERAHQQAAAAAHNPDSLLRIETVEAITGRSRSGIAAMEKAGAFPAAIRSGTRCTRWVASAVHAWVAAQAAK